ncbi:MAG: methyltransferase [Nitrospina sp.]|jgi:tRNA1Val (adenine37-N6)-methyltransferase|nr:methyltransferase [Nitrospina sp.]
MIMDNIKTRKELVIDQEKTGYRYSIEPFLLADFMPVMPQQSVLDIGTGCGIIPLLLVHREPSLKVTAIEIRDSIQAQKNIHQNGMDRQISLIQGDFLKEAENLTPDSIDHIVSNPPYRKIQTGRINPDPEKALARHELSLSMSSLLDKSAPLLKRGGQISLAYPPERIAETLRELEDRNLYPNLARFVHGNVQAPAKIFLISALKEKKSDFSVAPPLTVYNEDGTYSKEAESLLRPA